MIRYAQERLTELLATEAEIERLREVEKAARTVNTARGRVEYRPYGDTTEEYDLATVPHQAMDSLRAALDKPTP